MGGNVCVVSYAYKRLLESKSLGVCDRCGEPILVGDRVMSRHGGRSRPRVFHVECWKTMFLDVAAVGDGEGGDLV